MRPNEFLSKIRRIDRSSVVVTIFLALMSVLFIWLFSYSTSPLYRYCSGSAGGGDSAHFMTVGKAWAEGKVPYRDMFDHKGPIIYFVDMLGFLLRGTPRGIAVIQVLFLFATFAGIYQITQVRQKSLAFGVLGVVLTAFAMKVNYVMGNTVEEYCLPFLSWSFYLQLKYLYGKSTSHAWQYGFLYGIAAGICLMTRATNAIPLVGMILVIAIRLIYHKEFVNLGANALAFVTGMMLPVIPFVIYFAVHGCFNEMIYDVFIFNGEYSEGIKPWYIEGTTATLISVMKIFFVSYCIIFAGILYALKNKKILGIACGITGVLEMYLFMGNAAWSQYALVCLPQVAILADAIRWCIDDNDATVKMIGTLFACALAMFANTSLCEYMAPSMDSHMAFKEKEEREWEHLVYEIPENEKDSFVAYGNNDIKGLYLTTNTLPCYRYYMIQDWICRFSDKVKAEVYDTFASCEAKWIVVDKSTDYIDNILKQHYERIDESENYELWTLKQEGMNENARQ